MLIIALFHLLCGQTLIGQIVVDAVNIYGSEVRRITFSGCLTEVQVADARPFKKGDRVLLYQAKGMALADSSADSGTQISQGMCGNFEFATVADVVGKLVYLSTRLIRSYDINAAVQLVPVISSSRVTLNGPITATPWDGAAGGIIAIESTDTVIINCSISVNGIGFVGGFPSGSYSSCRTSTDLNAPYPSIFYGQKGEGAAMIDARRQSGRGRTANGGGGGANHNAGGAGGGNGGFGGDGGAVYRICGTELNGGLGGSACIVDPTVPGVFFGGGGGGGHQNERASGLGGNGGGIIIITAPIIISTNGSNTLSSRGNDARIAQHDGASGGGAGGTVFIGCSAIEGAFTIDVSGGAGGDMGLVYQGPHGPGGGGSGGQILFSLSTVPAFVSKISSGGKNGVNTQFASGIEHDWYAKPGNAGKVHLNCAYNDPNLAAYSTLRQISPSDLGIKSIGTFDTTEIRYVNHGPSSFIIDSLRFRLDSMIVLSSSPSLPTTLAKNDTLVIKARISRTSNYQYKDTLLVFGAVAGGCEDRPLFPFTWMVTDSCFIKVALVADTVSTGGTTRIVAIISDTFQLTSPVYFTAVIRYPSNDLYVAPSTTYPVTSIEYDGDHTLLYIESEWTGGDTLFIVEAMGLLSLSNSTVADFLSLSIALGSTICKTQLGHATIEISDVCATRYLRSIQFNLPSVAITSGTGYVGVNVATIPDSFFLGNALTISIWSMVGAQIKCSPLSVGHTHVDVPSGLYIVQISSQDGPLLTQLLLAR